MKSLSTLLSEHGSGVTFKQVEGVSFQVTPLPNFIYGSLPRGFSDHWFRIRGLHAAGIFMSEKIGIDFPYIPSFEGEHFTCAEANFHEPHLEEVLSKRQHETKPKEQVLRFSGQYIFLAGPGYHIYGHWIIDFLPKLYIVEQAGHDISTCKFLLPEDVPSFALEILNLIGIHRTQLFFFSPGSLALPDSLIIPTTSHNGLRCSFFFHDFGEWLRNRVIDNGGNLLREPGMEMIYLARGRTFSNRELTNRVELESRVYDLGFTLYYPEEMPLIDQWNLFTRADIVVGEYGSALHSSIFGIGQLSVCALHGAEVHPGFVQTAIGQSLYQPTGYIFGTQGHPNSQSYKIDITEFTRCIDLLKERPDFSLKHY